MNISSRVIRNEKMFSVFVNVRLMNRVVVCEVVVDGLCRVFDR